MEQKSGPKPEPWFIRHSGYIIGITTLTVIAFIALNFDFFTKNAHPFTSRKDGTDTAVKTLPEVKQLPPNTISIPSLNIEAPLVYIAGTTEDDFQRGLADGVVHYPGTARIGDPGNSYFFGHSSDLPWSKGNYKTVFEKLPDIREGDVIFISDNVGTTLAYEARRTYIVEPNETWVLGQFEYKKTILSLQTSYPVGTANQRFIVQAELMNE